MIRALIADDQAVVRSGFTVILEAAGDIEVVGEAGDGRTAVREARRLRPDVVCMDVRMPGYGGIDATRDLAGPGVADPIPVLVVTTFDLDDYLFGALEAGASGFLLKDADPDTLVDAVRSVAAGQGTLGSSITQRVIREFVRRTPVATDPAAAGGLSPRELDIVLLLAQGLSNQEIAAHLHLEQSTVKSHLARIMPKTGVRDRVQLVVWAYRTGVASA